mmetsp:Transcript_2314/g.3901  ORF Transcript_2314/g.3901 Transcript_2314/m.3901 type:complete len:253 (+) Transcript_2314:267-1025(+)
MCRRNPPEPRSHLTVVYITCIVSAVVTIFKCRFLFADFIHCYTCSGRATPVACGVDRNMLLLDLALLPGDEIALGDGAQEIHTPREGGEVFQLRNELLLLRAHHVDGSEPLLLLLAEQEARQHGGGHDHCHQNLEDHALLHTSRHRGGRGCLHLSDVRLRPLPGYPHKLDLRHRRVHPLRQEPLADGRPLLTGPGCHVAWRIDRQLDHHAARCHRQDLHLGDCDVDSRGDLLDQFVAIEGGDVGVGESEINS